MTLSQVSALSKIDKSTTLRLLYTLQKEEFVDYNEEFRKYSLGIELYRLGQLKYNSLDIREIAKKHLKVLCNEQNLIGFLGVRQDDQLVMLEKIFPSSVPLWTQLLAQANHRELYSTGIGRLFLSQDSDEEVMAYLNRVEIKKLTDQTIIDKKNLLDLVRQARVDRYSGNLGENEPYVSSLCVPIYNAEKKMGAGISICGPIDEIWTDNFDTALEKIRTVAAAISKEWGFGGTYY